MKLPDPWEWQLEALEFTRATTNVLLDMKMGSGKTRVIVDLVRELFEANGKAETLNVAIFCPKAVVPVWEEQFAKWWPGHHAKGVRVAAPIRGSVVRKMKHTEDYEKIPAVRLVVSVFTHAALISKQWKTFAGLRRFMLSIVDESHKIKAASGKISKAFEAFAKRSDQRICMTGTPLPHSPLDIFAQARFVDVKHFGSSHARFKARYAVMGVAIPPGYPQQWKDRLHKLSPEYLTHAMTLLNTASFKNPYRETLKTKILDWLKAPTMDLAGPLSDVDRRVLGKVDAKRLLRPVSWKNGDEMQRIMSSFMYQASPDLGLKEPHHIKLPVILEPATRKVYDMLEREAVTALQSGEIVSADIVLVKLLRLQQITGGTVKVDDDNIEDKTDLMRRVGTEKKEMLISIIDGQPMADPVVVFCKFHTDMDAVREAAEECGRNCYELSGRVDQLKTWQDEQEGMPASVLAVQISAGGAGISLVRACCCCYYSLGYSLGDYEQSLARVQRPGQERAVTYYHLIAKDTIDERVYRALRERKKVVEEVLSGLGSQKTKTKS